MTRTKLLTFLSALVCAVCLVFGIAACNAHEHTWSESWTTDSDYHWHAPNCDDTDEVKDKAAHVDANQDGKCDVCKYDVGHEHTFADGWTSDETHHWHEATCSHTNEKGSYAEHEDLDEDGECDTCHKAVEHKHRFAKEWSTDKDNHWHDATCSHQNEQSEFGPHIDEDQNGYCDVCDYEIGHEHSYEEGWTTSETQHWHAATCTHSNMKSELGDHEFDENGDCRTCHYHKHVFSEEWTVDQNKHWHVATCEDGGDEKSNEEAHDFGFSGKCKCGVEQLEINIYNVYYKSEQEFTGEEDKDFGAWHAELVKAGVKHVELDVLTQDVIYTYDNPDGEDITEVKYGSAKTVNVKITKGKILEKDERGLPDVTFKVIAKINGKPVANGKALGTGKINKISGEGEITFTPYFGYSSAKNHAGQKIEYAVTLTAEGDDNHSAIPNWCVVTGAKELKFTVSGDAHAETFTGNFDMERALGLGEAGKITGIDFGDPTGSTGYTGSLQDSSYYLNLPAGWYMLSYTDDSTPKGDTKDACYHVTATIDGEYEDVATSYALFYGKGENAYDAAIYIPEGAQRICFEAFNNTARNGTARLEPYELPTLKTDGSYNYVVASSYNTDIHTYDTTPVNFKLEPGAYLISIRIPGAYSNSLPMIFVNGTQQGDYRSARLFVKENDEISFRVQSNFTCVYTARINVNKVEESKLNEDIDISFDEVHKSESLLFEVAKAGIYDIVLTSESDLKNVNIGYGVTSTSNIIGTGSEERHEIKGQVYLNEGESTFINFAFTGSADYPKVKCKITEAQPEKFTLNEADTITINLANPLHYRSFTAEKDGYYTINATSTTQMPGVISISLCGVDGDVVVPDGGSTFGISGVFYAKKDIPVIICIEKSGSREYVTTADFKIEEMEQPQTVELNTQTMFNLSSDKPSEKLTAAFTFTAPENGDYLIIAYSARGSMFRLLRLGEEITELIRQNNEYAGSYDGANYMLTLEKGEKVDLVFTLCVINHEVSFGFVVNHSAPHVMAENIEETVEFNKDFYIRPFTFTAKEAGNYMLTLRSTSDLHYINVTNGEGNSLYRGNGRTDKIVFIFFTLDDSESIELIFKILLYPESIYFNSDTNVLYATLSLNKGEEMPVNESKDVSLGDGKAIKGFSFTATDTSYYNLILSSETSLKDVRIINPSTGSDIVSKITSSTAKFSLTPYMLIAGQKTDFLIVYEGNTDLSLQFRIEYDKPTEMTANEAKTIEFGKENLAEYYTFTATEAGTYTRVLTTETGLKNVKILNAETGADIVAAITSSSKYDIATFKMTAGQKLTFIVLYNITVEPAAYPTIEFRIEYSNSKQIVLNQAETLNFSAEKSSNFLSVTATEAGTYAFVLSSETSLKNIQIVGNESGTTITSITTSAKFKVVVSANTKLGEGQEFGFVVIYKSDADFPVVNLTVEYSTPTKMKVNTDEKITFAAGNNVEYRAFTPEATGVYTLVLTSETSLQSVQVYNVGIASPSSLVSASGTVSVTVANALNLTADNQLVLAFIYNENDNYPAINAKLVYQTPTAIQTGTNSLTFGAGENVKYLSFTSDVDSNLVFSFTSGSEAAKNIGFYDGATGKSIALTNGSTAGQKITADTLYLFIVTYTGTEEYTINVSVKKLLAAPVIKCQYNLITWTAVENATKYCVYSFTSSSATNGTFLGETTETFFHLGTLTAATRYYQVIAVDDTGEYADGGSNRVSKSLYVSQLSPELSVTIVVPEGFPTGTLLTVELCSGSKFTSLTDINMLRVTGAGSFEVKLLNFYDRYVRINPSTLPEGYTAETITVDSKLYTGTITITKTT